MRITIPMYEKGRGFILAGGLLKAYEGHRLVYLHLLCQGFENIGKAVLLATDYEKYGPLLQSKYGHNMETLLSELIVVCGSEFLSKKASLEVKALNEFYKTHQLRYGGQIDRTHDFSRLVADHFHGEIVGHLDALNQKFSRGAVL